MEEELKNFLKVWLLAITSLSYCYYVASRFPKGLLRLFSLIPVLYLFIILPLILTSFHLCGPTSFFLIWLANFKLLLFSFDKGPLSSPPPQNLIHFISLACLPIKLEQNPSIIHSSNPHNIILFPIKILLLFVFFHSYTYKHLFHPYVVLASYCLHLYLELEIILAISAVPARALFGLELEPQFNEPYRSTSLQDFWGRRWNLMVTSILRPSVYYPVRDCFLHLIGPEYASSPAIIATFVVSGLMHEIIYFYMTRVAPTWEVTWFFVLHGFCVAVEVAVKKAVKDTWRLHRAVSGLLTIVFVAVTGAWLFFPQLIRNKVDDRAIREYQIFVNFVKHKLMRCLSFISR